MIRILQSVNIMDRAGLETMLMNYYRSIDRSRIQFDFLTHREMSGAYDEEIKSMGVKIYHAPRLYPQNYPSYFLFMSKFFQEHPEYKIIHSHIDTMSAFPLHAAKKAGIPIRIGHSHSSKLDIDAKLFIKYIAKLIIPYEANIYCACGEKAGNFMYGNREFKIIPNAIDIKKFAYNLEDRKKVRKKLEIEKNFVVGHVGRYSYIKNQMFLLDIISVLKKQMPNIMLLLIGKGEDEGKLRQKVETLELNKNVRFLIDRSDVNDLYQAMDVFVMPSLFEGLPVVGVEAQANGLPCLFSDKISQEVVLTENAEMLSLKLGPEEWAKKIITLHRNVNVNSQEQLMAKGYDVSVEANKLMKCYLSLIDQIEQE